MAFASSSSPVRTIKISGSKAALGLVTFVVMASLATPLIHSGFNIPQVSDYKENPVTGKTLFLTYAIRKQPHLVAQPVSEAKSGGLTRINLLKSMYIYGTLGNELYQVLEKNPDNDLVLAEIYDYISHSAKVIIMSPDILNSSAEWVLLEGAAFNEKTNSLYNITNFTGLSQK